MLAWKSPPVHRCSQPRFLEVYAGAELWCYGAVELQQAPERVLVKAVNWLGDLVMSVPALKAVRRAWPQSYLGVLVRRELGSFFAGARWIDEVIPYTLSSGMRRVPDVWRIVCAIRRRRFDLAILLPNSFESALWPALARVPERVGFCADARGWLLTRGAAQPPASLRTHQVHSYLQMLEATLGIRGDAADGTLDVDPLRRTAMRAWLAARRRHPDRLLIALAPAAAFGPAKEWPAQHYAALIDLLAERHHAECVLVGSPGERVRCDEVVATSKDGALISAGEVDIGEAMALLLLCNGFVGNDSGATHVAAALGIPTVGLYGSTRPERTGLRAAQSAVIYRRLECSPCLQRTCPFGHYRCLSQISPQEVAAVLADVGVFSDDKDKPPCNPPGPHI